MDLDVHLPAIAAGDARAFAAWLAGAEAPLRRSLRRFARVVDTEAVLQEGLLRVWQVAPRIERDGKPNALLRMAHRIVGNAAIDETRRQRLPPPELAPEPIDPTEPDPLLRRAIAECRDKLPPKPAQALTARLGAHRSDAELAEGLGLKLNTFLQNVGRARKLLLECLALAGITLEVA